MLVRVTTGVEAHTHAYIATAHEDQKFGFSIAAGQAALALRTCFDAPDLELIGIHSHIGSQIFDAEGFQVAARRTLRLHAAVRRETGVELRRTRPRRRLRDRLHQCGHPVHAARTGAACEEIIASECAALGVAVPHLSIEPGRAISGPSTFALYEVGTVKPVAVGDGASVFTCRSTAG